MIADFKKPIILSTGASYIHEITEAVHWINKKKVEVALLHCVLNYPTSDDNSNLCMIKKLKQKFPSKIIGYSDHTVPDDSYVLEISTILGAQIIEKHFTLDKSLKGNDHYHSMDENDLRRFKDKIDRIISIIGQQEENLDTQSKARMNARRSIVASQRIVKGEVISENNITYKRPAVGINPKYFNDVLGKIANKDIDEDSVIEWSMFS